MNRLKRRIQDRLGPAGLQFANHATGAIGRLLPHIQVSAWTTVAQHAVGCFRTERGARAVISFGAEPQPLSFAAEVTRRLLPGGGATEAIDRRELDICDRAVRCASQILNAWAGNDNEMALARAMEAGFDEYVVASHISGHHGLGMPVDVMLEALHTLAEQSYENKSLSFGCLIDPNESAKNEEAIFPTSFFSSKKYKALSDGYRTAYLVSSYGKVLDFVQLDRLTRRDLSEKHFYPDWAEQMARVSRDGRCGICLSRQGDILIFDEGTLRLTYRFGQWQYWNHAHLVNLLRDRARAQKVPKKLLGRVVGAIYRAALDISFRRSGGLFVVLHNKKSLREVVRHGDAVCDEGRTPAALSFDAVISDQSIQTMPRNTLVELAALDGAIVLENSGQIVAYGAVLQPKRLGKIHAAEGSRTKVAIGASNYGLVVKISSDGGISVYHSGREFISV